VSAGLITRDCHCSSTCRAYSVPVEMEAEHCYMSGHDSKFECSSHYENSDSSNLKKPETSAREEWEALHQGKTPDSMKSFRLKSCRSRKVEVFTSHKASDSDILSRCERLGLALYTGPMVTPPPPPVAYSFYFLTIHAVCCLQRHLAP